MRGLRFQLALLGLLAIVFFGWLCHQAVAQSIGELLELAVQAARATNVQAVEHARALADAGKFTESANEYGHAAQDAASSFKREQAAFCYLKAAQVSEQGGALRAAASYYEAAAKQLTALHHARRAGAAYFVAGEDEQKIGGYQTAAGDFIRAGTDFRSEIAADKSRGRLTDVSQLQSFASEADRRAQLAELAAVEKQLAQSNKEVAQANKILDSVMLPPANEPAAARSATVLDHLTAEQRQIFKTIRETTSHLGPIAIVPYDVKKFIHGFGVGKTAPERYLGEASDKTLVARWQAAPKERRIFIAGSSADSALIQSVRHDLEHQNFVTFFYENCAENSGEHCSNETVGAFFATAGEALIADTSEAARSAFVGHEVANAKGIHISLISGRDVDAAMERAASRGNGVMDVPAASFDVAPN